jgi:hypothetical protein
MADDTSKKRQSVSDPNDPNAENVAAESSRDGSGEPRAEKEIGGRGGLDPTRYGDWEKNGRCIDF